ncbi:LOW QUALITY PROTEIN: mitochondrial genome maintenance exonuclease 1 [Lethenteron reissneri]|uniref:LOW QUALITY PROTEIN: mitochondrial genome maintenance exonuclease 1 n=1 Tax=Lethenteron reissneri TaxID=7753 RepID=UPI002AB69853|nr:LOW QUALITY PROTEIN: mitochondrial genome maintenance exonuclease 1 [Lethenteron reissneri]
MMFVLSKAHRRLWRLFASPTSSSSSTCGYSSSRKKVAASPSRYASAETERLQLEYQGLVQDLVSARCAQGSASPTQRRASSRSPVIRFRSPVDEQREAPEVPFPFLNDERHQDEGGDDDGNEEEVVVVAPAPLRVEGPRAGGLASVTRVLQDTMPLQQRYVLERWKRRMVLELGKEGFDRYSLGVLRQGRKLHAVIQEALTQRLSNPGADLELAPVVEEAAFAGEEESKEDDELLRGYARSVQPVLADLGRVRAVEGKVQHARLQYMGHIDCLAEYRGQLCLIDWKTSEKPKPKLRDTYDNPLQVVAYAGAVNYDANYAPLQVEKGMVVVAYRDGSPAHTHLLDPRLCLEYWQRWLLRLQEFHSRAREGHPKRTKL